MEVNFMQERPETLINQTSDLLEEIIPTLDRNIQMLRNDVNPEGGVLQYLLQQEIKNQESVLRRTKELKVEINRYLNPEPIDIFSHQPVGDVTVIMADREQICRPKVSKTLVEAIERIGIEKVKSLKIEHCSIPIITTFNHPKYIQVRSGDYFIMTNSSTDKKIEQLKEIKRRLNLNIEVIDNRRR